MITGFDVKNAMRRSYGISTPMDFDTASPSRVARALARMRAGAVAVFTL